MKFQLKRLVSQLFFLILANAGVANIKTGLCFPFFYCQACPTASAACPLRSLEVGVYKGNFAWKLILYPLLIIGLVGTLSGRAVCGWACPIGLLQRTTSRFARKLRNIPFVRRIGNHKIERYARYIKYVLLIGLVLATTALIGFMFTDICPVGFLTGTIPMLILYPGRFIPAYYFWIALVIVILFLILIFTVERGWCRYFCPVGALLAPFNKVSYLYVDVNTTACVQCQLCSQACPMGINVPEMHRDSECILCGKCITACPNNLIAFKRI
jgi:ferredoxin-type protein NapH